MDSDHLGKYIMLLQYTSRKYLRIYINVFLESPVHIFLYKYDSNKLM